MPGALCVWYRSPHQLKALASSKHRAQQRATTCNRRTWQNTAHTRWHACIIGWQPNGRNRSCLLASCNARPVGDHTNIKFFLTLRYCKSVVWCALSCIPDKLSFLIIEILPRCAVKPLTTRLDKTKSNGLHWLDAYVWSGQDRSYFAIMWIARGTQILYRKSHKIRIAYSLYRSSWCTTLGRKTIQFGTQHLWTGINGLVHERIAHEYATEKNRICTTYIFNAVLRKTEQIYIDLNNNIHM